MGCANPISLGINTIGEIIFQLPHGPPEHDYQLFLYVDVYDDSDGITQFSIETPVVVIPDENKLNELIENFLAPNNSEFLDTFRNASVQTTSTFILSLIAMINAQTAQSNQTNGSNNVILINIFCDVKFNLFH